jgi:hypothetical protein
MKTLKYYWKPMKNNEKTTPIPPTPPKKTMKTINKQPCDLRMV